MAGPPPAHGPPLESHSSSLEILIEIVGRRQGNDQPLSRHMPEPPRKKRQCNCKRSSCLKLYCECFASGVYCDSSGGGGGGGRRNQSSCSRSTLARCCTLRSSQPQPSSYHNHTVQPHETPHAPRTPRHSRVATSLLHLHRSSPALRSLLPFAACCAPAAAGSRQQSPTVVQVQRFLIQIPQQLAAA